MDLFQFTADGGDIVRVEVFAERQGSTLDPFLRLFDTACSELASDDNSAPGVDALLTHTIITPGDYFFGVSSSPGGSPIPYGADYQVHVSLSGHALKPDFPLCHDGRQEPVDRRPERCSGQRCGSGPAGHTHGDAG